MLEVIEGGFLTTVQDAGRFGWGHFGAPPGRWSVRISSANLLVGNPLDAAGLEITLTGPVLRASCDCLVAICGAEFDVWVGSLPVPTWHAVFVRAGYKIRFGQRRNGARAYLAVSGGIVLPQFLGSCATFLPSLRASAGAASRGSTSVAIGIATSPRGKILARPYRPIHTASDDQDDYLRRKDSDPESEYD
jgi:allophanate hydrolase subunit 2